MTKSIGFRVNPRFAAAFFFALFAIFFLVFTYYILLPIEKTKFLALAPTMFIVSLSSAIFGAIFGEIFIKQRSKLSLFFWGWLFALLNVIVLCFISLSYNYYFNGALLNQIHNLKDFLIFFCLMVLSLILIIGWLLFPIMGLAVIYFSKRFYPGLVATSKK